MFMADDTAIATLERIDSMILTIRSQRVMLDSDLAKVFGVPLKRLNEQVSRNRERFPTEFAFQLTRQEFTNLKSQFATSSLHGGKRKLPWAFTEHGAVMLSMVLRSPTAVQASVWIVRAFFSMREQLAGNKKLAHKLAELEGRVGTHDLAPKELFEAIRQLLEPATPATPQREIGFHIKEEAVPYRIKLNRRR
jgi:hypothetical protein